jgi:hypothetical protein
MGGEKNAWIETAKRRDRGFLRGMSAGGGFRRSRLSAGALWVQLGVAGAVVNFLAMEGTNNVARQATGCLWLDGFDNDEVSFRLYKGPDGRRGQRETRQTKKKGRRGV